MPERESASLGRRHWPVRRLRLGDEVADDLTGRTTAAERLAIVERLTLEIWSLSGRPLPTYSRAETPVRRLAPPVAAAARS